MWAILSTAPDVRAEGRAGASDRVPLAIDTAVNDWIAALFERAAGTAGASAA